MLKQLVHAFIPPNDESGTISNKQSEEKLHFSELRYRRLFETAQDGILILNGVTGKIDDVNPFLEEILGYSRAELLGKQLWEIGVFHDIVDSKKAFVELQNKGYIRYKDLPLQTKDGRSIDVEFVSNVYMVNQEKVIQCNIRDITARRQAEESVKARTLELESLTRSQEETKKAMLNVMEDLEQARAVIELEKVKDEAILESIGDGLVAIDHDGKVIVVNQAGCGMLGMKESELIGKKFIDVVAMVDEKEVAIPKNKRPVYLAVRRAKSTTTTTTTDGPVYHYLRKDGKSFPVAITVTPVINGKTIGAIEVFRNIANEIEIDKAKSEFVSIASHQLRTPLGIIKWYLEALESEDYIKNAPITIQKYLGEIQKSNERVLSLVRDLLSVSRIDQGRVKDTPRPVNVVNLVTEVAAQMQILAHKKKVKLNLAFTNSKIPHITIDALRFHEVVENLIANGIEYTPPGGKADVAVKCGGGTLSISVKDTGIGLTVDEQKKLFTKFFRAEGAIGYNPEGSGLGLYVVKSYVENWGGKVSVTSKEGKGSTFTIDLPISQK